MSPDLPKKEGGAVSVRQATARAVAAKAAIRRARVAELRVAGASFRQIAKEVGVSHVQAQEDWRTWYAEQGPVEGVEEYRRIQQERYEERILSARTLRQRVAQQTPADVADFARLQAIENESERGLQRLLGTDQPVRVAIEGTVGIEVDGSLEITAEDWARDVRLMALQDDVRKLLPAGVGDVIDVEPIVPAAGNGNGHG